MACVCAFLHVQEYDELEPRDSESLHDNDEDYSNDREYHIDDDDDLSYIETGRSSAVFNITKQMQHSKLLANVPDGTSDDSDEEEDYIALRSLVLYGNKFVGWCMLSVSCLCFLKSDYTRCKIWLTEIFRVLLYLQKYVQILMELLVAAAVLCVVDFWSKKRHGYYWNFVQYLVEKLSLLMNS